uniref:Uncharacterized protein n=1 Tax=Oryza punctata TaxID=4537 RepID=A0A0E0LPS7_ORYPU
MIVQSVYRSLWP